MDALDPAVITAARRWADHDPDETTAAQVRAWVTDAEQDSLEALAALRAAFAGPLTFGTAGLRAEVGPGESRMNVAVVGRATHGLVEYLKDAVGERPRIVLGCDARHGSHAFYEMAAEVIAGSGAELLLLPEQLPTPVTAFTVRHLEADAGIMITASHNPAADNGYKVYLGGRAATGPAEGVQIVPPADAQIAARIAAAPPADELPRSREGLAPLDDRVLQAYLDAAVGLTPPGPRDVRIVLTPMHGVGGAVATTLLERAGYTDVHVVPEQADPDPDFPTVSFPNPEEPGALDLALALAEQVEADVVIALDPDADRCSLAIPQRAAGWRQLTGDEIGALLADQAGADATRGGDVLAASLVSSRQILAIAEHHGLRGVQTLTGFKWIARTPDLRFGYEEAIGYCTAPDLVRDKDGITTGLRLAALAAGLKAQGRTIQDVLDDLARRHGLYATRQVSFRVEDLALIARGMETLRRTGLPDLAGSPVVETADLAEGYRGLLPTDGMLFLAEDGSRLIARPSGTEPKLKCYLETIVPVAPDAAEIPRDEASARLDAMARTLTTTLGL